MRGLSQRSRIATRTTAAGLVACLLIARVALDATAETVFVFGRSVHVGCLLKQMFGVPCPACGMTRSVVMALHGRVGEALAMNPAGVLVAAGVALAAVALVAVSATGRGGAAWRRFFASYGAASAAVLVGHWFAVLFAK